MAKKMYIGVNGSPKEVKKIYIGVNNVAKKVTKAYVGVNGVAKEVFSGGLDIVPWATGTNAQIAAMVAAADAGLIDLTDYWNVGDERVVPLSAMTGLDQDESHVAQNVTIRLIDTNKYDLVTATAGGRTKSAFVLEQKNCLLEKGKYNLTATNAGSWESSDRRGWLNTVYKGAFPSELQPIFKQFKVPTINEYNGNQIIYSEDYFTFATEKEIFNSRTYSAEAEANALTQFTHYATIGTHTKTLGDNGQVTDYWERTPCIVDGLGTCNVNTGGNPWGDIVTANFGIAPIGVI